MHAIPLTLVAGTGHLLMGNVDLLLLGQLLLGSVPGVAVGAWVGTRAPENFLRAAVSLVLIAVGSKMLLA